MRLRHVRTFTASLLINPASTANERPEIRNPTLTRPPVTSVNPRLFVSHPPLQVEPELRVAADSENLTHNRPSTIVTRALNAGHHSDLCRLDRRVSEARNVMDRRNRITNTRAIETDRSFTQLTSDGRARALQANSVRSTRLVFSPCRLSCGASSRVMPRGTYLGVNTCH
jgi:hypothetical protein